MSNEYVPNNADKPPVAAGADVNNMPTVLLAMLFSVLLLILFVIGSTAYFYYVRNGLAQKKAVLAINETQAIIQKQKAELSPHWINQKSNTASMGIELAMDEVVHQDNPNSPSPLLSALPSTSPKATNVPASGGEALHVMGKKLYASLGCIGCHTVNGNPGAGPSWKNLAGYPVDLTNGKTVIADYKFLRIMILYPGKMIVKGFANIMPNYYAQLAGKKHPHETPVNALIWYINTLSNKSSKATQPPVSDKSGGK